MQVGIDSFAAALDENSRALNRIPLKKIRCVNREPQS